MVILPSRASCVRADRLPVITSLMAVVVGTRFKVDTKIKLLASLRRDSMPETMERPLLLALDPDLATRKFVRTATGVGNPPCRNA